MPRIADQLRECVVYIYPDEASAEQGKGAGGTGFLVGVQSKVFAERHFAYVVTNRHIITACPTPVIRFNTQQGQLGLLITNDSDWQIHEQGDDLAAISIDVGAPFRYLFLSETLLLTKELVAQHDTGPGEEVFFVGRFVNHEGRQQNWPALRFGHISMMPWEPIEQEGSGLLLESFVIEGRSVGGYSGSPVFVHIPPLVERPGSQSLDLARYGPWLLGVDWGHLWVNEKLVDRGGKAHPDDLMVRSNAGMTCVAPAWKLRELLDQDSLVKERAGIDARLASESRSPAASDSVPLS